LILLMLGATMKFIEYKVWYNIFIYPSNSNGSLVKPQLNYDITGALNLHLALVSLMSLLS